MHEETRVGHLVERRQGGDKDRDAAVAEHAGEEEVLCPPDPASSVSYRVLVGVSRTEARTKRVMASVYKTRMKRNLKKCAASCARPAIQYVLWNDQRHTYNKKGITTRRT